METDRASAVRPVLDDLQRVFGDRLEAVVVYGWRHEGPVPTLALVRSLSIDDLNACAARTRAWRRAGAATPLLLTKADFTQSLDAFPIEYGEILQQHTVLFGADPFEGLAISRDDLRRACEVQVKSHLLHLREDYLESGGHYDDIDLLVRESAPGFEALLRQLARLDGETAASPTDLVLYAQRRLMLDPRTVGDLIALSETARPGPVDAVKLFPAYLETIERLANFVDRWRAE
ncbi:MAG TPA: hypothetical protein VMO26_09070 [Vicinamibacterales bacterium]|nr:hypothetical protein [Vicinamibacterales bacterium]